MHQTILFVIVIGRWLLPTSTDVTRDELSQILFGFIGVGADIMEFITESLKETAVKCSEDGLQTVILFFWCLSLLQFILVLTSEVTADILVQITEEYLYFEFFWDFR